MIRLNELPIPGTCRRIVGMGCRYPAKLYPSGTWFAHGARLNRTPTPVFVACTLPSSSMLQRRPTSNFTPEGRSAIRHHDLRTLLYEHSSAPIQTRVDIEASLRRRGRRRSLNEKHLGKQAGNDIAAKSVACGNLGHHCFALRHANRGCL
jgi:hypothetical protein